MSKQMTPLRQRMIEDMAIRNMSPSTQKIYVRAVANFSIYHGRSPDKLTFEDVRDYRLHLISRGLKPNSINPIMGALARSRKGGDVRESESGRRRLGSGVLPRA